MGRFRLPKDHRFESPNAQAKYEVVDDGRDLTVDMKDVSSEIQKALTSGEAVTVVGFYKGDDKHVTAKFIQQDSSAK